MGPPAVATELHIPAREWRGIRRLFVGNSSSRAFFRKSENHYMGKITTNVSVCGNYLFPPIEPRWLYLVFRTRN